MSVKNWLNPSALGRKAGARSAVVAAAVFASVFAFPTASRADDSYFEWCSRGNVSCQTGTKVSGPSGQDTCYVEHGHNTQVCINYDGDIVYVLDGVSDGHSAVGAVSTPDAGEVSGRWCRNPHGVATWAKCNFDWVEDTKKTVYGGVRIDNDSVSYTQLWTFNNN
jgi:hypothetical protein